MIMITPDKKYQFFFGRRKKNNEYSTYYGDQFCDSHDAGVNFGEILLDFPKLQEYFVDYIDKQRVMPFVKNPSNHEMYYYISSYPNRLKYFPKLIYINKY